MTTYTPFLRLSKPPFDDIPWDDAVNGNMDILDAFNALFMSVPNFTGAWRNSTNYVVGQNALDIANNLIYTCNITHMSGDAPLTFTQARINFPLTWTQTIPANPPTNIPQSNRNLIHNSRFRIQQRGIGPFTVNAYCADRWIMAFLGGTCTGFLNPIPDTDSIVAEVPDVDTCMSLGFVGGGGAGDYVRLVQHIEDLKRISTKTVILSFYTNSTANITLGVSLGLYYGTGGSPSAPVYVGSHTVECLEGGLTRRYAEFTIPSYVGKTFGTDVNSDYAELSIWLSAGSTLSDVAGGIGVQTANVNITGVQLEIVQTGGSVTPLEPKDIATEVDECRRYYQRGQLTQKTYGVAPQTISMGVPYSPIMRTATPIALVVSNGSANLGAVSMGTSSYVVSANAAVVVTGSYTLDIVYELSAEW